MSKVVWKWPLTSLRISAETQKEYFGKKGKKKDICMPAHEYTDKISSKYNGVPCLSPNFNWPKSKTRFQLATAKAKNNQFKSFT